MPTSLLRLTVLLHCVVYSRRLMSRCLLTLTHRSGIRNNSSRQLIRRQSKLRQFVLLLKLFTGFFTMLSPLVDCCLLIVVVQGNFSYHLLWPMPCRSQWNIFSIFLYCHNPAFCLQCYKLSFNLGYRPLLYVLCYGFHLSSHSLPIVTNIVLSEVSCNDYQ